jgi:DNA-binding HxlR family transcriptional regulator
MNLQRQARNTLAAVDIVSASKTGQGDIYDVGTIIHIAEYFRFRWDPPILAELGQRPSRFRALASRLETQLGAHLNDNALSRSLHRLTRHGLITADCDKVGRRDLKVYRLTPKGVQHAQTYEVLIAAFTRNANGIEDA